MEAERSPDSPLGGQSVKIDPAQLQAVLALGMASAHRKPTPAPAKAARALRRRRGRFVTCSRSWIALSAGAIAAATLAFR